MRTLAMVQRYSHLAPEHLREAVGRLVTVAIEVSQECPVSEPVTPSVG